MGYMNFKDPTLETIFKLFKWSRNNTILIFNEALKNNILSYTSPKPKDSPYAFQPILFQFQCIVTTTDTYYRQLTYNPEKRFGIFVDGDRILKKDDITFENINKLLTRQLSSLESLLKDSELNERVVDRLTTLSNHEYLHQGQLVLMFREANVELPERFQKAWAL